MFFMKETRMKTALSIENLSKQYPGFLLDHISFQVPEGSIMGFIGENGAGKSTTIKLILNMLHRDSGNVTVLGQDMVDQECEIKDQLGVVLGELNMPDTFDGKLVNRVMKGLYSGWEEKTFFDKMEYFGLDRNQKLKGYSKGMRIKLAIAIALSHQARFLILDEPTSGLDPVIRAEILNLLLEFIQDEQHSVLISSHIVEDLERIADYITFIHKGRILLSEEKDQLLERYQILRGPKAIFGQFPPEILIGYRENLFGAEAMIETGAVDLRTGMLPGAVLEPARIEDIMLYHVKGGRS